MRAIKILTFLVLGLALLAVVGDRGGKMLLERIAAGRMQDALDTKERPGVSLGGVPFLPDLVKREFGTVEISVRDADAGRIRVARVDAVLHGVKQRGAGVQASSIDGDGLITYPALGAAAREATKLPAKFGYGGDGLVKMTAGVVILGRDLSASASSRPRIEGDLLIIKPEKASSTGLDDETATAAVQQLPEIRIPLRDVPKGLEIDLNPTAEGMEFSFRGKDVFLASADSTAQAVGAPTPLAAVPAVRRESQHAGQPSRVR